MTRIGTRGKCHHRIVSSRRFLLVIAALISFLAFSTAWQEFVLLGVYAADKKDIPGKRKTWEETMSTDKYTRGWAAWVNLMPPSPKSLHVRGSVEAPHPGYEAVLRRSEPQGINPSILLMDLELRELPGNWPQKVVTDIPVTYDENPYKGDHKTVTVKDYAHMKVYEVH